jgi:hypothetical protein
MEFLKTITRRSFLHDVLYVVLNVALAIALMVIIQTTGSLWLALLLVLLSLWRIFAVRPRYWVAHIQANLVNIIVSVSFVVLLYVAASIGINESQILVSRIILTLLYIGWLLFLKPQSKRVYIALQAAAALLTGTAAVYSIGYSWAATPVVLLTWAIGYATARHILSSYDEEAHTELLSLMWGFTMGELGWLAYHWSIAYRFPFLTNLLLPQISIISLCIGFVIFKSYDSYSHHGKIRINDIALPLAFSAGIILVLLLFFNGVSQII